MPLHVNISRLMPLESPLNLSPTNQHFLDDFFMLVLLVECILCGHLLWSIFQSSITHFNQKTLKMTISTRVWGTQHPNAGQNMQHLGFTHVHSNSKLINFLFSLKNSRPYQDSNLGQPMYQADMLPTELSWLGSFRMVYLILDLNFFWSPLVRRHLF